MRFRIQDVNGQLLGRVFNLPALPRSGDYLHMEGKYYLILNINFTPDDSTIYLQIQIGEIDL